MNVKKPNGIVFALFMAALMLIAGTPALSAQAALDDWSVVTALSPGTSVRIRTADGKMARGTLVRADSAAVVISSNREQRTLDRTSVVEVRRRRPNGRDSNWNGTAIGAGVGAAWGAGVLGLLAATNENNEPLPVISVLFRTVGMSALTGFFVDALIGERFDRIYQRV